MFRNLIAGVTLATAAFAASSAYALVDAQLLVGKRWYEVENSTTNKTSGVAGQEVTLAAHIDPIPLVPIAFGGSFSMIDLNKGDLPGNVSEAKVAEAAVEVMAWVPMVPVITPYVRFKYPVVSEMVQKYKINVAGTETEYAVTSKLTGYHLNAGVRYAPLPLISFMAEVGMGMQQAKLDEYEVNGTKQSASSDASDANSQVFLLGVQVGL